MSEPGPTVDAAVMASGDVAAITEVSSRGFDGAIGLHGDAHRNLSPLTRELRRVGEQIGEHLRKPHAVAVHERFFVRR